MASPPPPAFAYLGALERVRVVPEPPPPHTSLVLPVVPCAGVAPLVGDLVPLLAATRGEIAALTAAASTGTLMAILVPAGGGGDGGEAAGPASEWTSPQGRGGPGMRPHPVFPCMAVVLRLEWTCRDPPDSPGAFAAVAAAVAAGVAARAPRGAAARLPPGLASPPGSPDRVAVARVDVGGPADAPLPRETVAAGAPRVAWRAVDAASAVAAASSDPAVAPLAAAVFGARLSPSAKLAALAACLPLNPRARARLLTAPTVAAASLCLTADARALAARGVRCGRCGARWTEAPPRPPPRTPQVDALLAVGAVAVNPHGHAFGLALTGVEPGDDAPGTHPARSSPRLFFDGPPNEEASWVPGHAWSMALCADCACHAGWRFDAVHPQGVGARTSFLALRRAALADPDAE